MSAVVRWKVNGTNYPGNGLKSPYTYRQGTNGKQTAIVCIPLVFFLFRDEVYTTCVRSIFQFVPPGTLVLYYTGIHQPVPEGTN